MKPSEEIANDAKVADLVNRILLLTGADRLELHGNTPKMDEFTKRTDEEILEANKDKSLQVKQLHRADALANPKEEIWSNDKYCVHVNRGLKLLEQPKNEEPVLLTHLSIKSHRNSAEDHDWRDYQEIKNQLVGEENEGFELYPRESRLVDTCNQFHMFVFEDPKHGMPIGFFERCVIEHMPHQGSTQRPWPNDKKPKDLEECTKRETERYEKFLMSDPS